MVLAHMITGAETWSIRESAVVANKYETSFPATVFATFYLEFIYLVYKH